jgi:hypothetical protein
MNGTDHPRSKPSDTTVGALLRGTTGRRVEQLAQRISAALPSIEEALTGGSLVVIEPSLIRSRPLPIL